jgi:hypothetical protein
MRSIFPMWRGRLRRSIGSMLETGSGPIDAERAFRRAARARRRASLARRLRRLPAACSALPVFDERTLAASGRMGITEVPLCSIRGTLEPSRAEQFDGDFRPAPIARDRWERVWLAMHRGAPLPPISLVAVREGYAIRDGHHRVSVARAREALTIDAMVDRV